MSGDRRRLEQTFKILDRTKIEDKPKTVSVRLSLDDIDIIDEALEKHFEQELSEEGVGSLVEMEHNEKDQESFDVAIGLSKKINSLREELLDDGV